MPDMASVRVNILKIVDDTGYPTFVEFELIDSNGISHHFIDKVPIISADDDLIPPCDGEMRCMIVGETKNTFLIDTALPDDMESLDGDYQFEVNKEQVIL